MRKWAEVAGSEGRYEVSNDGLVRSRNYKGRGLTKILSLQPKRRGHLMVGLLLLGRRRWRYVHQLVLEAFVGSRPFPAAVARHLNGDPSDNRVENLAWGTKSQNAMDAVAHGTHCCNRGERNGQALLTEAQALQALKSDQSPRELAKRFGVSPAAIYAIRSGQTWGYLRG